MDTMLDSITDGFFMVDRNWRILGYNRVFDQLLHARWEEQTDRYLCVLCPDGVNLLFYS
jgi:PAS domain-containing protein